MIKVTIQYGRTNVIEKTVREGTTIGDILRDTAVQNVLGFGTNVQGSVDSVAQEVDAELEDGDVLVIEARASAKAS